LAIFDYNGFVDDDDVTLLGAFYDPSAVPLVASASAATANVAGVPEPQTWDLIISGAIVVAFTVACRLRQALRGRPIDRRITSGL
jgi:hypothetical protein